MNRDLSSVNACSAAGDHDILVGLPLVSEVRCCYSAEVSYEPAVKVGKA